MVVGGFGRPPSARAACDHGGMRDPREHVRLAFFRDGRLTTLPARAAMRQAALEALAERFVPGRVYPEAEVNRILSDDAPDHATLRRLLVDHRLLERAAGAYRRIDR
jgi:hypothetical protein